LESGLYIVATPIGHLDDITLRALRILQEVDLLAAEDTRHTRKLLQHHGIERSVATYHEHSSTASMVAKIQSICAVGGACALVSDAGTPLISDPGYELVRAAQDVGIRVVPIPGPSATIAAVSAAGLPSDRFLFAGFGPAKDTARRAWLSNFAFESATLVFYEAPHRIVAMLADAIAVYGGIREACICRELTKTFETIKRGTLSDLAAFVAQDSNQQRGEFVVLIKGSDQGRAEFGQQEQDLLSQIATYAPPKIAAAMVADYLRLKKKPLYQWLLESKNSVD
jgi:16S rRNA (cytidine1402-2'-O)-methyltransferase